MSAVDTARSLVELAGMVGKTGWIRIGGLAVEIRILDVKQSYGKTRFQVTPLKGAGTTWVESITFPKEES